ncbi:hypothetical protein AOA57_26745 [Pseudomonas sp. 2588-5]|jgi:type 1 fimbria pilin|nr:hypothetical protein AOA57_26745 [Pseudomonas sp. 2588-5]
MKAFFPTCTATLLLAAASTVQAASSTDLTVKGMITPSACSPALSNGGSLDFGKISSSDLRKDRPTYLPRQTLQMTVTCEGATMMALEAKDNREGTESSNDYYNFGLGLINGTERLGYLTLSPMNRVADGVGVSGIVSWDGGTTWEREPMIVDNGLYSVAPLGSLTPIPVTLLTTDLSVSGVIAPTQNLTLDNEVNMDGSVTITVRYL